ncbi:MAG: TetR/AcrR family transcriptional regulator [Adlercreutzia sp.]|nr:TetR/AcrR family transcriptional regulator [Adlercreutzia sp.]
MGTVEKKADLRVLRTRAALRDAFNELMEETTLDRITVKTLTERAGINRKTFYLHFETIEAFYDSIMNGIMDDFFENYETTADDPYDIDGHAQRFFLFLASQPPIVERLICAPGLYDFGERIYRTQMNRYKSVGNPFDWMPSDQEELVKSFIRNTALDFYRQWVREGKTVPESTAAQLLSDLTCHGVEHLMR